MGSRPISASITQRAQRLAVLNRFSSARAAARSACRARRPPNRGLGGLSLSSGEALRRTGAIAAAIGDRLRAREKLIQRVQHPTGNGWIVKVAVDAVTVVGVIVHAGGSLS